MPAFDEAFKPEVLQVLFEDARARQGFVNSGADFFGLVGIGEKAQTSIENGFAARVAFAGDNGMPQAIASR